MKRIFRIALPGLPYKVLQLAVAAFKPSAIRIMAYLNVGAHSGNKSSTLLFKVKLTQKGQ